MQKQSVEKIPDPNRKTKKVIVKKKRGQPPTPQNIANAKVIDTKKTTPKNGDFNLDPNIFNLMQNLPKMATVNIQKAIQDTPKEQLDKMSFQDVTNLITKNMAEFPVQIPQVNKTNSKSQSFDMSKMVATLMKNAEMIVTGNGPTDKKSGNSYPSMFDGPPEIPERSGKYSTVEDEKKQHLIYKGFNVTILSLLTLLTEKLPHKTAHYELLRRMIESTISVNPCKPREIWKKTIQGKEDKVQKYSEENIMYICKNLNSIELLNLLELENEWDKFTTDDFKSFHNKLSQLQNLSELIDSIPTELMSSIQNMTLRVNNNNTVKLDENGNPADIGDLFQTLAGEVFKDPQIFAGMQKMSSSLMGAMADSQLPEAPGYSNILKKANS